MSIISQSRQTPEYFMHQVLTTSIYVIVFFAFIISTPCKAQTKESSKEPEAKILKELQGVWVRTVQRVTMEKKIDGHSETLMVYDQNGNALRVQTTEFRIQQLGKFHVLSWSDGTVTAGRGVGSNIPDGTMITRIKNGKWYSAIGFSEGESYSPYTEIWSRPDSKR